MGWPMTVNTKSERALELLGELRRACAEFVVVYDSHPAKRVIEDGIEGLFIVLDAWVDYRVTGE